MLDLPYIYADLGDGDLRDLADFPGELRSRYKPRAFVGRGAAGDVYRAIDLAEGTEVAIKVSREPEDAVPPVWKELQRFRHPSLLPVRGLGRLDDGRQWTARAYAHGRPLSQCADELSEEAAVFVANALCDVVSQLHKAGILHGDIKPDNVVVDLPEGRMPRVYLIDFGLAVDGEQASRTRARGTLLYMAPELLAGETLSTRSDNYALAATLYFLFTGIEPYTAEQPDLVESIHSREILKRPETIPPRVRRAIQRGLSGADTTEEIARRLPQLEAAETHVPSNRVFGRDTLVRQIVDRFASSDRALETIRLVGEAGIGKREVARLVGDSYIFDQRVEWISVTAGSGGRHWIQRVADVICGAGHPVASSSNLAPAAELIARSRPRDGMIRIIVSGDEETWTEGYALAVLRDALARSAAPPRVNVLLAFSRPMVDGGAAPPGVRDVEVGGLSEAECLEWLNAGAYADDGLVKRRIITLSEGRPSVLRDLLHDRSFAVGTDEAPTDAAALRVRLSARRMQRLSESDREILGHIALLGGRAWAREYAALGVDAAFLARCTHGGVIEWTPSRDGIRLARDVREMIAAERPETGEQRERLIHIIHARFGRSGALIDGAALLNLLGAGDESGSLWRSLAETLLRAPLGAMDIGVCVTLTATCPLTRTETDQERLAAIAGRAVAAVYRSGIGREHLAIVDVIIEKTEGISRVAAECAGALARARYEGAKLTVADLKPDLADTLPTAARLMMLEAVATSLRSIDRVEEVGALLNALEPFIEKSADSEYLGAVARVSDLVSKMLVTSGRRPLAVDLLRTVLDRTPSFPTSRERTVVQSSLGSILLATRETELAGNMLRQALDAAKRHGWHSLEADTELRLAVQLNRLNRWYEAVSSIERAIEVRIRAGNYGEAIVAIIALAQSMYNLAAYRSGRERVERWFSAIPSASLEANALKVAYTRVFFGCAMGTTEERLKALDDFEELAVDTAAWASIGPQIIVARCQVNADARRWSELYPCIDDLKSMPSFATVPYYVAVATWFEALAEWGCGKPEIARRTLAQARPMAEGHVSYEWRRLWLLSELDLADGEDERAARRLASAIELVDSIRKDLPVEYRATFNTRTDIARIEASWERQLTRQSRDAGELVDGMRKIMSISRNLLMNSTNSATDLLREALAQIVEFSGAERGSIMIPESGRGGEILWEFAARIADGSGNNSEPSRTFLNSVYTRRSLVHSPNALVDDRFSSARSVQHYGLRSVLGLPLQADGHFLGVVYLEHSRVVNEFSEVSIQLLEVLTEQLAGIIASVRRIEDSASAIFREFPNVIGVSLPLQQALRKATKAADAIKRVATGDRVQPTAVLLVGETGVGKNVIAEAIHTRAYGVDKPFIEVNCASIPSDLFEAELFGVKRGAYTSANASRNGLIAAAAGGTLFLDEIGEMPDAAQAKLLHFLQNGRYRRVGDNRELSSDVRIVAATNRDLKAAAEAGEFRQDLYFRIAVLPIEIPPLRKRVDDIPVLTNHFLQHFRTHYGLALSPPDAEFMEVMKAAPWPGNVRQLRNVLERLVVYSDGGRLSVVELDAMLEDVDVAADAPDHASFAISVGDERTLAEYTEDFRHWIVQEKLKRNEHNVARTARALSVGRKTVYKYN